MCGIIGCIGISKNNNATFKLLTNLMIQTQRRGEHATGFYAIDRNNQPFWHKEPGPAKEFVQLDQWNTVKNGFKAFIGHDRYATNGSCEDNKNNHPNVSKDGKMAFMHNGIVYNYDDIKSEYDLETECDSEIILQNIIQKKTIIEGIENVFETLVQNSDFTCQILCSNGNDFDYYLFRETNRPAYLIDMTLELGQYFIVSEPVIWMEACYWSGYHKWSVKQIDNILPFHIYHIDGNMIINQIKVSVKNPIDDFYTGVYLDKYRKQESLNSKIFRIKMAVVNPELRYANWHDDAYHYNLITKKMRDEYDG